MRLLNFYTPLYRNLHNFAVVFTLHPDKKPDEGCSVRFLVGPNGSGKSNLLRFLASIFAALNEGYRSYRADNPAYTTPFHLIYELGGRTITIASKGQGHHGLIFIIDVGGKQDRYEMGDVPGPDFILPESMLIYTSGTIEPWQKLLQLAVIQPTLSDETESIHLFITELLPNEEEPASMEPTESQFELDNQDELNDEDRAERIILVEPSHLPLALLAAFFRHDLQLSEENENERDEQQQETTNKAKFVNVLEQVKVLGLLSFSLRLAFDLAELSQQQQELLAQLQRQATLALDKWGEQGNEQLWLFDLDEKRNGKRLPSRLLSELAGDAKELDQQITPFAFFRQLVELQENSILRQLYMIVNQETADRTRRTLLVDNLSDGEGAFLQRMALIHLLNENERLFLFDEPEVHFNDNWKRNLVDHIERTLRNTNSEVILTTHSSITLTDAYPEEVIRLGFHGQQNVPLTLGTDPGEILRSVYGADESVGERATRKINQAIKKAEETNDDSQLRELLRQVGPGYQRFRIVEVINNRAASY
jgi:ABC-type transport system involved in cytochrome c biogenesis ATPase subunit